MNRTLLLECGSLASAPQVLLAELKLRNIRLHDEVTKEVVEQKYAFGELLGRGSSAFVYAAEHRISPRRRPNTVLPWGPFSPRPPRRCAHTAREPCIRAATEGVGAGAARGLGSPLSHCPAA